MTQLPYWIFSESYGGKMTAHFGVVLYDAIANDEISMNFEGVTLGDSWISGISYVNTWPQYLYGLSLIDNNQYNALMKTADSCQDAINKNQWKEATNIWAQMEEQVDGFTNNVDWYYVLQFDTNPQSRKKKDVLKYHHLEYMNRYLGGGVNESQIAYLMNHKVKEELGMIPVNVTWGGQSGDVFAAQSGDFMKPVVDDVDRLLAEGVKVNIWNGQLDLICCTLGTLEWLQTITWKYKDAWHTASKVGVENPQGDDIAYFKKEYLNLRMYYMMKSGHMVPADNPVAAYLGVCDITLGGSYPC